MIDPQKEMSSGNWKLAGYMKDVIKCNSRTMHIEVRQSRPKSVSPSKVCALVCAALGYCTLSDVVELDFNHMEPEYNHMEPCKTVPKLRFQKGLS